VNLELMLVEKAASSWDLTVKGRETPLVPTAVVYDIQMDLARYLSTPWLSSKDRIVFGEHDGNRIEITFHSDDAASVTVFSYVRKSERDFLGLISDLAHFQGCRFYEPKSRQFIDADLRNFPDTRTY
jgi:hypothetical protein